MLYRQQAGQAGSDISYKEEDSMAKCAKKAAPKDAKPAAKKSGCAKSAKPCAAKKKA